MEKFSMYEFEAQLINDTEYLVKSKYDTFRVVLQNRTSENPRIEVATIGVAGSYRWQFGYDATGAGPTAVKAAMQNGSSIYTASETTPTMFATFVYYCGYYLLQHAATSPVRHIAAKIRKIESDVNTLVFSANNLMDERLITDKDARRFSAKVEKFSTYIHELERDGRTSVGANLLYYLDALAARLREQKGGE